jgi:hypothetical protein
MESLLLPCGATGGVPARGVVPERCHASGAAVDLCSAAPAWAQRAGYAAEGSVIYVSRALWVASCTANYCAAHCSI